jgi:hypothetical protein
MSIQSTITAYSFGPADSLQRRCFVYDDVAAAAATDRVMGKRGTMNKSSGPGDGGLPWGSLPPAFLQQGMPTGVAACAEAIQRGEAALRIQAASVGAVQAEADEGARRLRDAIKNSKPADGRVVFDCRGRSLQSVPPLLEPLPERKKSATPAPRSQLGGVSLANVLQPMDRPALPLASPDSLYPWQRQLLKHARLEAQRGAQQASVLQEHGWAPKIDQALMDTKRSADAGVLAGLSEERKAEIEAAVQASIRAEESRKAQQEDEAIARRANRIAMEVAETAAREAIARERHPAPLSAPLLPPLQSPAETSLADVAPSDTGANANTVTAAAGSEPSDHVPQKKAVQRSRPWAVPRKQAATPQPSTNPAKEHQRQVDQELKAMLAGAGHRRTMPRIDPARAAVVRQAGPDCSALLQALRNSRSVAAKQEYGNVAMDRAPKLPSSKLA